MSTLFVAGCQRSKILEAIDVPFHHLAAFVGFSVEFWWPATSTALLQPRLLRILTLRTDTDDLAAAQMLALLPRTICTIHTHHGWTLPGAARSGPPDTHLVQQGKQVRRITGLTLRDQHRQRATLSFAQDVDLAVSSPSADSEPFVIKRPLFSSWAGCFRAPTAERWALQLVLSRDAPFQSIFP